MSSGPMRWDCDKLGCFNKKLRPKLEVFKECFSNGISFGDIDGIVEVNGRFLMLEWKSERTKGAIPRGQWRMYEMITRGPFCVVIAEGDAETMVVNRALCFYGGKAHGWKQSSLDDLRNKFRTWYEKAKAST